jgi:hypothetical protein
MEASIRLIEAASAASEKPLRKCTTTPAASFGTSFHLANGFAVSAESRERGVIRMITQEKQVKDYKKAAQTIAGVSSVRSCLQHVDTCECTDKKPLRTDEK